MRGQWSSIVAVLVLGAAAAAQSTALTYQGRLKSGGEPASGLHDFRFRLFDAAQGGSQLGTTQCLDNLSVADGLFTTPIDFGQQFASPDQRFLEIQVRKDTGLGCGNGAGFVTLTPRQPLTAAPLASHAKSAFALDAADGGPANAVLVDDAGRVGIGTQAPGHSVTVASPGPTIALQDTDSNSTQVGYISYRNADNVEMAWVGFGDPANPHFSIVNARSGGNIALLPFTGNVGIGTSSPTARLEVHGDIRLGSSGQFRAAAGDENLRIVRGVVSGNGGIISGSGFTVNHLGPGFYEINYTTSFSSLPAVTATRHSQDNLVLVAQTGGNGNGGQTFITLETADGTRFDKTFQFIAVGSR